MRLLLTGGTGFLGTRVTGRAIADGHHVLGLARSAGAAEALERMGAEPLAGDLDDAESVDTAFQAAKADALVNLASLGFGHADAIVAAAEAAQLRRAVFVSTTAIFTTLPAASKRVRVAAERRITSSDLDWTIVRPTMIYGAPGDRNMSRLIAFVRRAPAVPLPGGGGRLAQPVHVDDLAGAVLAAVTREQAIGRCYDVAGPEALSLRAIVAAAGEAAGRRPRCVSVPLVATLALVGLYERAAAHPRLRAEQIARLAEDKAFAIDGAAADLGFAPRSFTDGIRAEADLIG